MASTAAVALCVPPDRFHARYGTADGPAVRPGEDFVVVTTSLPPSVTVAFLLSTVEEQFPGARAASTAVAVGLGGWGSGRVDLRGMDRAVGSRRGTGRW